MSIPSGLQGNLRVPVIAAPLFLSSGPDLVVATSAAGVIGTFPALNARTSAIFADWAQEVRERLAAEPSPAAFGVNIVAHSTNLRLEKDVAICVENQVPLVITSLGAAAEIVDAVTSYGGVVFHDVTNIRHAEKAIEAGVDGLILVSAGAGGHAGTMNPFAFVSEVRSMFAGTICVAGAMNSGRDVAAARMLGADFAYIGTRFNATQESMASAEYKQMLIDARAVDIQYRHDLCVVPASFLRQSLEAAGMDPRVEQSGAKAQMTDLTQPHTITGTTQGTRLWRDIWSAGQGVGGIVSIPGAAELVAQLQAEYQEAARVDVGEVMAFTS